MNIISIESTSSICGVSLFINGEVQKTYELNKPRSHGKILPSLVEKLLVEESCQQKKLNGVWGNGPSKGPSLTLLTDRRM